MSKREENIKKINGELEKLSDEELEIVSGGGWGWNIIHDEDVYKAAGVETDWTKNPFVRDKFYYNGVRIEDATAAAICFYKFSEVGHHDKNITTASALEYKANHVDEYKKFIENINK